MSREKLDVVQWRSDNYAANDVIGAWEDVLNTTFGSWALRPKERSSFSAVLTTQQFDGMSVTQCICDPCAADRTARNISQNNSEKLTIQLVLDGLERMKFCEREYLLQAGDIFIWDNTQRMVFDVQERLHKISITLPLQRLKNWVPNSWHSISRKISSTTPSAALLKSHLTSLSNKELQNISLDGDALSEATVALLVCALGEKPATEEASIRLGQLEMVKHYINENLGNSNLTLEQVATENRISLRYLHWLFNGTGTTAAQYILEQRLNRCRRDLMNPSMANRSISSIAYSWGFNDPNHFSRRFKKIYSVSPSESRVTGS